jgi:hypothetical protein
VDIDRLLRWAPVKAKFGPTLPALLAPRIDSLPRTVSRVAAAVALVVVAAIVVVGLRSREPVFSHPGPPELRFSTKYSRALTREPATGSTLLSLRQNSVAGLAASFQIAVFHLPAYQGEVSGLLPVLAIRMINRLAAADSTFVLWSEGRTRINFVPGYTFTFQRTIEGQPYWGRDVLLTAHITGDREGLLISMLTDPGLLIDAKAQAPITPNSVATVGVLFDPLERLRFG